MPNPMQAFDQRLGPLPSMGAQEADPLQMLLLQGASQGMGVPSYDSEVPAYQPPPLPHRPTSKAPTPREAPSVAPNFFDYLDEKGVPLDKIDDSGYDAIREKFFRENVLPSIIKNKEPLTSTREEWFRRTERPGKSEWPRARAAAVGAVKGLAAPVLGLVAPEMARGLERDAQAAAAESEKQNISGLYEMAGDMVGQLPYWVPAFRAAKLAALGVAGKTAAEVAGKAGVKAATEMMAKGASSAEQMVVGKIAQQAAIEAASVPIQKGLNVVAGGVTAGLYSAAAAQDGHRITEGVGGFVGGAAMVGGFELLGFGLSKFLSRRHGLSQKQGDALEAAARGQATEQQQDLVANALETKPQIEGDIKQWVTRQVQMAKRTANPREPLKVEVAEKGKRGYISIKMKGADGKEYPLRRLDPNNIDLLVKRIDAHLTDKKNPGEIIEVTGSASAMNALYLQFENIARSRGEFGLPVILRGEGAVEGGPLATRPRPGQPLPQVVEDVVVVRDAESSVAEVAAPAQELPFRAPIRPPVRPPSPPEGTAPAVEKAPSSPGGAPPSLPNEVATAGVPVEKMAKARAAKGPEFTIDSIVDPLGRTFREGEVPQKVSNVAFDIGEGFGTLELHPSGKVGFLWVEGQDPVKVQLPEKIVYTEKGMRQLVKDALSQLESGEAVRSKKLTEAMMHPLDKIEALPNGMYRNTFTGEMFSSKSEAIGSRFTPEGKLKYGVEEPTRRGILKGLMGGAAKAAKGGVTAEASAAKVEALTKALSQKSAESAGYAQLKRMIEGELSESLGTKFEIAGIHGPFLKLVSGKDSFFRDIQGIGSWVGGGGEANGLSETLVYISNLEKVPASVRAGILKEIREESPFNLMMELESNNAFKTEQGWKALHKLAPEEAAAVERWAKLPQELADEVTSVEKIAKELPKLEKEHQKLIAEEKAEAYRLQRAGTVTPGMELQRTPAQLGETGEGGVMMRYGARYPLGQSSWVDAQGKVHIIKEEIHEDWTYKNTRKSPLDLMREGWIRVAGDSVDLLDDALKPSKSLEAAIRQARRGAGKKDVIVELSKFDERYEPQQPTGDYLRLSEVDTEEFLANPRAFFMRNKQRWAAERPTTTSLGTPIPEPARSMREAPSSLGFQERPRADRLVTPFELDNPLASASAFTPGVGKKPTLTFLDKFLAPKHIYHENLHGDLSYTGLSNIVENLVRDPLWDPMGQQLFQAFAPNVRAMYGRGGSIGEETFVYLAQAIRLEQKGEKYLLDAFIDADGSREEVFEYANSLASKLLREVESKRPSVNKSDLQRKLKDLTRRTGGLKDLGRDAEAVGEMVDMEGGRFTITKGEETHFFATRPEAEAFIEKNFREPLNAPELVDSTYLPEGLPRYAAEMPTNGRRPPKTADPLPHELSGRPTIEGKGYTLSHMFRPFYPWLDDVTKKNNRPDLYSAFDKLRSTSLEMEKAYTASLKEVEKAFKQAGVSPASMPYKKRVDLATYMRTPTEQKAEVAAQLNMTSRDVKVAENLRQVYDWGYGDTGVKAPYEHDYVMRFTPDTIDTDVMKRSGKFTQGDIDFIANHVRSEEFDFADRDIVSNMATYFRLGYKWKFMKDSLKEAAKLVDEQNEKGEFVTGSLRPLLRRHLDYLRGVPDYTQRMVNGALEHAQELFNAGVEKVNRVLPEGMQLEKSEMPAQDILGKYILFSYAGGLGLRPMTFIRDAMQLLTTTIGVLGPRYTFTGMERAFRNPEAWAIADKYGWLMKDNPLHNLYSGGYEKLSPNRGTELAETVLKPLKWSNNSNRLIAGWGHYEKAIDAIRQHAHTNPQKMAKEIGLHYLDEGLQKKFIEEIAGAGPEAWDDIAKRITKHMVDFSQWDYRRGASPGIYKYALGRLFGQYGTWPLNYIEFLRHVASRGDAADKAKTLSQLALSHYAILYAGESAGVDTGTWVGLEPAAYSGGPLLQGVQALPSSLSTESIQGQESRRTLRRLVLPGPIPGGLAAERVFKAVTSDDPDLFKILLGFQPLKPGDENRAMHALVP